jgi:hypothetical protein
MSHTTVVLKNCFVCDYNVVTKATVCPQCDARLRSSTAIRIRGGGMALMGLTLMGLIAWVANEIDGSTRIPTAQSGSLDAMIYIILAGVFVLGGLGVLTGGWLLATGRRNKKLLWLTVASGVALSVMVVVLITLS